MLLGAGGEPVFVADFVRNYATASPFVLVYAIAGAARTLAFSFLTLACSDLDRVDRRATKVVAALPVSMPTLATSRGEGEGVAKDKMHAATATSNAQVLKLVAQLSISAGCAALYGGRLELCSSTNGAHSFCWAWLVPLTLARVGAFAVIIAGALLFFGRLLCLPALARAVCSLRLPRLHLCRS